MLYVYTGNYLLSTNQVSLSEGLSCVLIGSFSAAKNRPTAQTKNGDPKAAAMFSPGQSLIGPFSPVKSGPAV